MSGNRTVQDLFFEARGVAHGKRPTISRAQLTDLAIQLPGAPEDLTTEHLRSLEIGTRPPPGAHLRYFAAAAGIPLLELLAASPIGYWPEVPAIGGDADDALARAFVDLCRRWGLKIASSNHGRIVVEMPR